MRRMLLTVAVALCATAILADWLADAQFPLPSPLLLTRSSILTFNDFKCGNSDEADLTITFASNASSPSACVNLEWPPTAIMPASSCTSDFDNITLYDSKDCEGNSVVATYSTECMNPMFFIRSVIAMIDTSTVG